MNGYISLAIKVKINKKINGHAFNFGPKPEKKREVLNIVKEMSKRWISSRWKVERDKNLKESNLLQLNSKKAKKYLNWQCKLNLKQAIQLTVDWYKIFYFHKRNIFDFSVNHLTKFKNLKR